MSSGIADNCASPITIVLKKDNSLRLCMDYTVLNAQTRPISYLCPGLLSLQKFSLKELSIFCLDFKEAYYSLLLKPISQKYAAIVSHHWVFIPFHY